MVVRTRRFEGKVALVTGGNSGIGLATAKAFAAEGARVVIAGRDAKTLESARVEIGGDTLAVRADVARLGDIGELMRVVREEAGRIDALFVNAGIAPFAPIESVEEAQFDALFDTNVKGAFFTIQQALPLMSKGAAIVITSSAVTEMGMPGSSAYTASKAAVQSFARTLAGELAPRGIRINVVQPGPIDTPIYGRLGLEPQAANAMAEQIREAVPFKRFGRSEEIAAAVLFLCSSEAQFLHGASILADGGLSRA